MNVAARLVGRLPSWLRRILKKIPGAERIRSRMRGQPTRPGPVPGQLRPVVYLPTWVSWHSMRQRPHFLLAAFADAGHDVYLVDTSARRPETHKGVRVVPSLESVPDSDVVLYVHFAPLRREIDKFTRPVVIYDLLDDLSIYDADEVGMPEHRRVRSHHPLLMKRADVVIASSEVLVERHRSERSDILLVENGVDVVAFGEPRPRPSDLPPGPVVGFHGAVATWFDFELFEAVAVENPGLAFVLVGPVLPEAKALAEVVGSLSNVHLLGERPSDEIAAYVQHFDVEVIWFRVDSLTEAVSPLKLFEALAAGVPAVSTPLPASAAVPGVALADDAVTMSAKIAEALEMDAETRASLRAQAALYSWEERLEPLIETLEKEGLRVVGLR